MNQQLQTVLDALERIDAVERGMVTTKAHHYAAREETTEAIAIVRQMMQAEPVAWVGEISECSTLLIDKPFWNAIPLYAVPVSSKVES
jgi:hypothetical protein